MSCCASRPDIFLKIEPVNGYSPLAPRPCARRWGRDAMFNPGHELGLRVLAIGLLLPHPLRAHRGCVADPQLKLQFVQETLEPSSIEIWLMKTVGVSRCGIRTVIKIPT